MSLVIQLTPDEEAQLSAYARQNGLAPAAFAEKLVKEHLPVAPANAEEELNAKLRLWQQQDGVTLGPDIPASVLFAQWAEEDANMTEEEKEAEAKLWEELEKAFGVNTPEAQERQSN